MAMHGPPGFLVSVLPSLPLTLPSRPHVTLTYAQSLDGCIAGVGGKQLILSGKESMVMTHWLRTMHEGILIGIGTALNDDPQLNTRHLPVRDDPYPLPRPIILDTELRTLPSCKLLMNYRESRGRRPWIICSNIFTPEKRDRMKTLEQAGAKILLTDIGLNGLDIDALLVLLRSFGINSLMVEGGQRVISSFLSHLDADHKSVVDALIVTIAPILVGATGVGALPSELYTVPKLRYIASAQFGRDTVMACHIADSE